MSITYFKQTCDKVAFLKAERNVLQLRLSDGEITILERMVENKNSCCALNHHL